MVNASGSPPDFVAALPREISPECTSGREGFVHPVRFSGSPKPWKSA